MQQHFSTPYKGENWLKVPAAALLFIALCFSETIYSQNLYWGQQYGGPATLTGGTAVVGVEDNTSLFYNPGAAALIDSAKFTASTFIYGVEYKNLKNGAGKGVDLNSLDLSVVPQMVASDIRFKKARFFRLMYGTMTRFVTDVNFAREYSGTSDVIAASPGAENYSARLRYNNGGIEQWLGVGASIKVAKHWAFGFTTFATYTHIGTHIIDNISVDAFSNGEPYTTNANEDNSFSLNQLGLVFKLGLAVRYEHVQVGISATMPGIKLYGRGSLDKSFESYNLNRNTPDSNATGLKYPSYVISDVQGGLKTSYKQPFAVALGLKFIYSKIQLSVALEYFNGYSATTIVQGVDQALIRPATAYGDVPVPGFMTLQTSAHWIMNAGIGLRVKVKPKFDVLLGLRTDFNNRADYLPNNAAIGVPVVQTPVWHFIYLSAGCSYKAKRHEVTFGFDYGQGIPANSHQLVNFAEPQQQLFLRGPAEGGVKTYISKANLILSWTYFLKKG